MKGTENMRKWTAALRSGEYQQLTGWLAATPLQEAVLRGTLAGHPEFACCLGVGCDLMGVEWEVSGSPGVSLPDTVQLIPRIDGHNCLDSGLPPAALAKWLGLDIDPLTDWKIVGLALDTPPGFEWLMADAVDLDEMTAMAEAEGDMTSVLQYWGTRDRVALATLNDGGVTFDQIADLIDHFGVVLDVT